MRRRTGHQDMRAPLTSRVIRRRTHARTHARTHTRTHAHTSRVIPHSHEAHGAQVQVPYEAGGRWRITMRGGHSMARVPYEAGGADVGEGAHGPRRRHLHPALYARTHARTHARTCPSTAFPPRPAENHQIVAAQPPRVWCTARQPRQWMQGGGGCIHWARPRPSTTRPPRPASAL